MNKEALFRYPKIGPDQAAKSHELRTVEVVHDPDTSFALPVPSVMSTAMPKGGVPHRHCQPEPLALFAIPPRPDGPRLHVSAQSLQWEVDPLEWLRWLAVGEGWRVAMLRTHREPGGPWYEIGALREVEGVAVVRRTKAVRTGGRVVCCDASAPLDIWEPWHDALWLSLDGFHLGQSRGGAVEALLAHDEALVRFAVPGSWESRTRAAEGDGSTSMARIARDAQRGAALKVQAQRLDGAPSAQQRRDSLWREMREGGAHLGAVLSAERPEFAALLPGWVGQWQAALQTSKGDGVVVVVQREDRGVALDYILAAPAAGTDHIDWRRATRALDVAIATSDPKPPTGRKAA